MNVFAEKQNVTQL